jgi:DNA-binding transcriptional LysR family regulator
MVNLSAIDLNLLWVLHAVLAERSVAGAAKKLHVTSPAVSNALGRLRGVLDDPLFVRSGRGLTPTPRALELQPVLAQSFGAIETSLSGGEAFDPKACTRELSIALSDADQVSSLPAISRAFARRLPRARLRVVTLDTLMASGGLAGPAVDVTIGPPFEEEGLHSKTLFHEPTVLFVRRDHPRIGRKLSAKQFNSERHVDIHLLLGKAGAGNKAFDDALRSLGLSRDIAVTVPTFAAAASVVSHTDFIGGMPQRMAKLLGKAMGLKIVEAPGPAFAFEMRLHWHQRTHHDPAVAAFRSLIIEALGGG